MGEVVDLDSRRADWLRTPRGSDVWQCECGCCEFHLRRDGDVECARCGAPSNGAYCRFNL